MKYSGSELIWVVNRFLTPYFSNTVLDMRKISLGLFVVVCFCSMGAVGKANSVRFNISRPYCVFNFLEAAKGVYGTSDALRDYIVSNTSNDPLFKQLVDEYTRLDLDVLYARNGFPELRPAYRSIKDLLIIQAVQAKTIAEFGERVTGILHSEDQMKLIELLKRADVWYEKLVWAKYGSLAKRQLKDFENYTQRASEAFLRLRKFYRSEWPEDLPFLISLTPVPGKKDATAATPHANVLCMDILVEQPDYPTRIAIALHEVCHVLYAEQGRQFQSELARFFSESKSPFSRPASTFFDEGLATANGNGWVYNFVSAMENRSGWYSNPYIDGFGHALYPLTSRYLAEGKPMDQDFVNEAIRLFGEKFPKAPDDFGILMNRLVLHSHEEEVIARNSIKLDLYENFSVYYLNFTSPILSPESTSLLNDSPETQLVIIDRDYENTMSRLKTVLPELGNINYQLNENFIIHYRDTKGRLVMIAKIDRGTTQHLFQYLKKKQFLVDSEVYSTL